MIEYGKYKPTHPLLNGGVGFVNYILKFILKAVTQNHSLYLFTIIMVSHP